MPSGRYFGIAVFTNVAVIVLMAISLSSPWYHTKYQESASPPLIRADSESYWVYKPIISRYSIEDPVTGRVKNSTTVVTPWSRSNLIEFRKVFQLAGPFLIVAVILDVAAFIIAACTRFISSSMKDSQNKVAYVCILYRRRWILMFVGLVGAAMALNLLGSLIFLASPTAYKHDVEHQTNQTCSTGPCISWSGTASSGMVAWGPEYGWYESLLLLRLSSLISNISLIRFDDISRT